MGPSRTTAELESANADVRVITILNHLRQIGMNNMFLAFRYAQTPRLPGPSKLFRFTHYSPVHRAK